MRSIKLTIKRLNFLALPGIRTLRMGPEDMISHHLAVWLRDMYMDGRTTAVFTHIANEGAGKVAMVRKKAIGMVPGCADWVITENGKSIYIELKAGRNKLSDKQLEFKAWCEDAKVDYFCCYSLEEAQQAIIKAGLVR